MLRFFLAALIVASTPAISWAASVSANLAITITSAGGGGTAIQATDFCAANGGGNGSSGSPWHADCIRAAINAAASGSTVFFAAGNWSLSGGSPVIVSPKDNVTLTGAGSGNTFDAFGHPNNGQGGPVGTVTRFATDTVYGAPQYLQFLGDENGGGIACSGLTFQHIYVDGSLATAGGDAQGTVNFRSCPDSVINPGRPGTLVNDIRVLSYANSAVNPEDQFNMQFSDNAVIQSSVFTAAVYAPGQYSGAQLFQSTEQNHQTIQNNMFYGFALNPFYMDNATVTGNGMIMRCDSTACPSLQPAFGFAGCSNQGCGVQSQPSGGSHHDYIYNNFIDATGSSVAIGGGVNDPSTGGILNDLQVVGNTMFGSHAALDSCVWHIFGSCQSGVLGGVDGMQINGAIFNSNTVIATTEADINATGTGQSGGNINTVVNFVAHQNYLSSPSNQYLHDSNTITPSVSSNVGLDVGSITAGPSCSFTLGPLSGSTVPFSSTSFTAQYGSVRWLAATSPATPSSGDARWNYLPPFSLTAAHGNTVYLWVMDSANNISAPASATIL